MAQSRDLVAALALFAALLGLQFGGGCSLAELGRSVKSAVRVAFETRSLDIGSVSTLLTQVSGTALRAVLPIGLLVLAVTLCAGMAQTGFLIRPQTISPGIGRISPRAGLSRVISWRSGTRGLFAVLKLGVLAAVLVVFVSPLLAAAGDLGPAALMGASLGTSAARSMNYFMTTGYLATTGLLGLSLLDWLFQRWRHERDLRMTRQELLEELEEQEPDSRIRRQQQEQAGTLRARWGTRSSSDATGSDATDANGAGGDA